MRILITGASGLVGRNLSEGLSQYDLLTPSHSELDLLDYASVLDYIKKNNPELIIHCAGKVGGIQANIDNPVAFYLDNLDMGRNVVLAAKNSAVKKLINLGSSCMYPRNADNPLKEDFILKGELEPTNEGYALAKIATMKLCDYLSKENSEYKYKTLIPCNLYGSYDKFDPLKSHMIPAVIRKIDEAVETGADSVEIWGDGLARREFMHVNDLVDCIKSVISDYDKCPMLMNVGLGFDFSINEYYEAVAKVIGFKGSFNHDLTKPVGMKQKVVDVSVLHDFGWKSSIDLYDGIKLTYDYYLNNIKKREE